MMVRLWKWAQIIHLLSPYRQPLGPSPSFPISAFPSLPSSLSLSLTSAHQSSALDSLPETWKLDITMGLMLRMVSRQLFWSVLVIWSSLSERLAFQGLPNCPSSLSFSLPSDRYDHHHQQQPSFDADVIIAEQRAIFGLVSRWFI